MEKTDLRSPICVVVGHVDHGKSSILDSIRGTCIIDKEAGKITQAIGASIVPVQFLKNKCGKLLETLKAKINIPGLLFVDTPGHEAFSNLRARGGNLADIAILVVDINEGFMPQTIEAIEILKNFKIPFVVAANKIDLLNSWKTDKSKSLMENIESQRKEAISALDTKLYELVGKIYDFGFNSERFDRISDYTKEISIVPVSAKEGVGIAEVLMIVSMLAQKYLSENLSLMEEDAGKGIVLEVKNITGMGRVLDVILYDGKIKKNHTLIAGTSGIPAVTKIRGLFELLPLSEIMDKSSKFVSKDEVTAATAVRICAPEINEVVAGMPVETTSDSSKIEEIKKKISEDVQTLLIDEDSGGVVVKANSLGSLEALNKMLKDGGVSISFSGIGNISKKDIAKADSNYDEERKNAVVLGFNVNLEEGVIPGRVNIITSNVIYDLIDKYNIYSEKLKNEEEREKLAQIPKMCKLRVLSGYVFRQSHPAVFGVEVLEGELATGNELLNSKGNIMGSVKSIQKDKERVELLKKGDQAAISLPSVVFFKHVFENDILLTDLSENNFKLAKEYKSLLTLDSRELMKEVAEIKRRDNKLWGI